MKPFSCRNMWLSLFAIELQQSVCGKELATCDADLEVLSLIAPQVGVGKVMEWALFSGGAVEARAG